MSTRRIAHRRRSSPINAELICGRIAIFAFLLLGVAGAVALCAHVEEVNSQWKRSGSLAASSFEAGFLKAPLFPGEMSALIEPLPGDATARETGSASEYTKAYSRLNRALQMRREQSSEELVQRVHQVDESACPISWKDSQPSLHFGAKPLSLSQSLDHCAEAIEKLR